MPDHIKTPMTNWYDPLQLIDTAKRTIISTTVGQYADPRAGMPDADLYEFFDYSKHVLPTEHDFELDPSKADREEIWIDYAADVGDGFNPTYAIAYYMSRPQLKLEGVDDLLPRGEILFLGGDGVYPTANPTRYENQLVAPYRMALKAGVAEGISPVNSELSERPHIFALPGNHDWYDSLVAFKQLFCSHVFNDRKFGADENGNGGWTTRQRRSYFTLKLPQKWWLLAVDLQLSHNIDVAQLQYFESVIRNMEKGDRVILCVPEPYWEKYIKYGDVTDKYEEKERSIAKLDRYFLKQGVEVRAFIAGDLHHYRRFEDGTGVQKITAGGGGAFLHPTHDFDYRKAEREAGHDEYFKGFSLRGEYPDYRISKSMGWKDFLFPYYNRRFGKMTAVIYFVLALLVHGRFVGERLKWTDDSFWFKAMKITVDRMIEEPLVILVVVLLLLGLVFFTDSNSTKFKWFGGLLHGAAHLTAAFMLGWLAYVVSLWLSARWGVPVPPEHSTLYNVIWFASVLVICGVGGYILGALIMGAYLYISLHVFGRHSNEAFSALKIEGYKNFLRLHIDKKGDLTIYPIKIDEVPGTDEWTDEGEYFRPAGGTVPALIENKPIVVR